jgi:hypothetical protein
MTMHRWERTFLHNNVAHRAVVYPLEHGTGRIEVFGAGGLIGSARYTTAGFISVPPRLEAMRAVLDGLLQEALDAQP